MEPTDRILKGTEELFLNAGIKSVTMDDIAKHLGMSKKTIYQHFKDKDEIVTELVSRKLKDDKTEICSIMNDSVNVIEQLINMMKRSEEMFGGINPIVIHDMQKYHPSAWAMLQSFKADFLVEKIESLLEQGIKEGYVRENIDVKILARMRVSQVEMGFNTWLFPVSEFNPWRVQYQFLEHFCFGICTYEGYKYLSNYVNNKNK